MQIVIDLPKAQYDIILRSDETWAASFASKEAMMYAIKTGTPLPKGHGDLIDKSAYRKEFLDSRDFEPMKILDFQPVIIEADRGEE